LCNKLFPREDGIINNISIRDNDNARNPEYQNHCAVGKNRPKNINTISVWKELKKYANPYLQFDLSVSLINVLSMSILNGSKSLVLRCISTFCPMELATTEKITTQKATIITGVAIGSEKSTFLKMRYTAGSNTANWDNLAIINDQLNLFIFQNNCSGNCWIHTNILLAEYIIARGRDRMMN
jgi:hypothetical protein